MEMILLFTLVTVIGWVDAWLDIKWQFREKIVFDTTDKGANIKENLTGIPIPRAFHTGDFTFANAKEDDSDIRFVSADEMASLKFHIEKSDPKQMIVLFRVEKPQIAGGGSQDSI